MESRDGSVNTYMEQNLELSDNARRVHNRVVPEILAALMRETVRNRLTIEEAQVMVESLVTGASLALARDNDHAERIVSEIVGKVRDRLRQDRAWRTLAFAADTTTGKRLPKLEPPKG